MGYDNLCLVVYATIGPRECSYEFEIYEFYVRVKMNMSAWQTL